MAYWNYRVIKHEKEGETWLSIHEVHFDDNGKLVGFAVRATEVFADNELDMKVNLQRMMEALDKPILTPDDFSEAINVGDVTNGKA